MNAVERRVMAKVIGIVRVNTKYASEKESLRQEKKRMNEIVGAQIFRELVPIIKCHHCRLNKKHKVKVHYRIMSVFPDKDSMDEAYNVNTFNADDSFKINVQTNQNTD